MGEPVIKGQISNCATGQISTKQSTIGWYSEPTDQEKKFVCQIRQGRVCPGGWVMHGDNCFKWFVGGHYWRSWYGAEEYCTTIGAKMLTVKGLVFFCLIPYVHEFLILRSSKINNLSKKDPETQHYISAHHANLQRDGVSGYWLGARAEDAYGTSGFVWTDGYPIRYNEFSSKTEDATGEQCVMATTTNSHGNWEAETCNQQRAFVCIVGVGGLINIPEDEGMDS